MGTQT